MSEQNDGGPAFPSLRVEDCNGRETRAQIDRTEGTLGGFLVNQPGASLRAYIATSILNALIAAGDATWEDPERVGALLAKGAVAYADALLAELKTPR